LFFIAVNFFVSDFQRRSPSLRDQWNTLYSTEKTLDVQGESGKRRKRFCDG
jgi:hypothetical protein